jgi:peptidyl-prolyl cis-trans isomerase C
MSFQKRRNIKLLLLVSISLAVSTLLYRYSYNDSSPKMASSVVAMVADRSISVSDFTNRMVQRSGGMTVVFQDEEKKQALLREMVQREAQVIAAEKAGYAEDPDITHALETMMITKLREAQLQKVLADVTVTDEEVSEYYYAHSEKYVTPAMSRAAIIHFVLSDYASKEKQAEVKARADNVYKLAQTLPESAKGFGALAATYSEDQATRYVGGDIGWITPGNKVDRFDPVILETLGKLNAKGEIAPVAKGKSGLYLIKLIDMKPEQRQSLEETSSAIRRFLLQQKRAQAEADWLASLESKVGPVTINEAVLKSIDPPPTSVLPKGESGAPGLPRG